PNYFNFVRATNSQKFNDNWFAINRVIYLGEPLGGRSSLSGANLPNPTTTAEVPGTINLTVFDSTWNAPNVNPADPWINNYYLPGNDSQMSTQSENIENYV